jgi:hypothetical protein
LSAADAPTLPDPITVMVMFFEVATGWIAYIN